MKKIILIGAAILSFGVASAQTEPSAKKQSDKNHKKEKTEVGKTTSTTDQKAVNEENSTTINAKDDPARANSNVANPSGMNSPATTKTSPGSTASPTGSKPDSDAKP